MSDCDTIKTLYDHYGKVIRYDTLFKFFETFDRGTGMYMRSDALVGPEKGHDPFMRSAPE